MAHCFEFLTQASYGMYMASPSGEAAEQSTNSYSKQSEVRDDFMAEFTPRSPLLE